jgi:hypothetical protein
MDNDTKYEYPSSQHETIGYPYRVWIFSFLLAPVIIALLSEINRNNYSPITVSTVLGYIQLSVLFFVLTIPAAILYLFIFYQLIISTLPPIQIKILSALTAIGSIYSESLIFQHSLFGDIIQMTFIYLAVIIFSLSLTFRLKEK